MENSSLLWNFPIYVSERICLRTGQGVECHPRHHWTKTFLQCAACLGFTLLGKVLCEYMCECVGVCLCMCVCVYLCVCTSVCVHKSVCVHVYIYIYVCMSVDIYVCVCAYVYIHICLCVYVFMGMYVCVCDGVPMNVSMFVVTIPSSRPLRNN